MKYAHLADLHLGSWRDQKMRDVSTNAFLQAIDTCIEQQVDFILFAGDLFNTSLPALDTLKIVTKKLKELKDRDIPLYTIAGSHDFSPSGKTMIDVLENAGLLKNVCRGLVLEEAKQLKLEFTIDPKTGAKITGVLGRKGLLDKAYYENLCLTNLEEESGYKIFMFHTTIAELLPEQLTMIEAQPLSFLPKGFAYYAGGHIHHPTNKSFPGYGIVTYTGALFPNNFQELEKYGKGFFNIITVQDGRSEVLQVPIEVIKHRALVLDCRGKSPDVIQHEIINSFAGEYLRETILTIRLKGKLQQGRIADIDFKEICNVLYAQGAYFIMKNTTKLFVEDFEEIAITQQNSPEEIEDAIIKEHLQQLQLFDKETEIYLTKALLHAMNTTKKEGETTTDFQKRIETEVEKILDIQEQSNSSAEERNGATVFEN